MIGSVVCVGPGCRIHTQSTNDPVCRRTHSRSIDTLLKFSYFKILGTATGLAYLHDNNIVSEMCRSLTNFISHIVIQIHGDLKAASTIHIIHCNLTKLLCFYRLTSSSRSLETQRCATLVYQKHWELHKRSGCLSPRRVLDHHANSRPDSLCRVALVQSAGW